MKDETLKNAFQGWDLLSANQEEVLAYEARLKQVLDEEATRIEAELREKEALEKGLEKGLQKGLAQGREEGATEEKKATVQRMLREGIEVELIAKLTDLTVEQVKAIKQNNN
ncbi:hypothetical protein [Bacillus sp. FJAT-42315]|uniref:hypothetical protein n=1 Tax=Bacillus sp. FJAT-42315 TaxID=2014077 RepID=UPI000C24217B|nr:hypothetical protein [Bacillus sp. FJAT-42315]